MNKADLVQAVEARLGSRKAATEAVEVVLETIVREVAKGNRVSLTGFGTFEKVARAPRTGRNPRTGETVKIRKTAVPRFSASTKFKDYVKAPRSLPKNGPALARQGDQVHEGEVLTGPTSDISEGRCRSAPPLRLPPAADLRG